MVAKVQEATELMGLICNMNFVRPCLSHSDVLLFMGKLLQAKELQAAYLEEKVLERLGKRSASDKYLHELKEKWDELMALADAIVHSLPESVVFRAKTKLSASPPDVRRYLQTQVEERFRQGCLLQDLRAT